MRAVIVGAGIGGPAAAMALQRAGIEARVFEARGPDEARGSYLTVASNGVDALRAIGAEAAVGAGFPTPSSLMFSGTGKCLGRVPLGSTRPDRDASVTIKRARLQAALRDEAARRGIAVAYHRRLVRAERAGAGIRAVFDDGSDAFGDLLIGCDGVHSRVRQSIDPHAPAPRYVGLLNFGGYTPGLRVGEPGTWQMIFGARAFFGYVADAGGRDANGTIWFANVPRHAVSREERESTAPEHWRRWLIDLFQDDRGPAADLIARGELELAGDNTHDLRSVPVWHNDRMIVIGDAAHAPSPSSGQGASMAIEDAVVLARCLRDASVIPSAFAAFERLRRRRVERIVTQGARSSSSKAAGPIARIIRDHALPLVFRYVVTEKSMAWLYDHHIDFESTVAIDDAGHVTNRTISPSYLSDR